MASKINVSTYKRMRARIFIPEFIPLSKQHSRGMNCGRIYKLKSYSDAMTALAWKCKLALRLEGWLTPTAFNCALRVTYRGRFDVDNAGGFVQDALQGVAYVRDSQVVMATYRKRRTGPYGIGITVWALSGAKK
jgi:Holliday junction resolvase RusA-like endonuclease